MSQRNAHTEADACGSELARDIRRTIASKLAPTRGAVVAALLLALPGLALALSSDKHQGIDVGAAHSDGDFGANARVTLDGEVYIEQGSLRIDADHGVVEKKNGAFSRAVFTGSPARMQQQLDGGGMTKVRASKIDYDPQAEIVVLTGDVVVTQPEGELRGETVRYDIGNGHMQADSQSGDGRVHMRIEPSKPAKTD